MDRLTQLEEHAAELTHEQRESAARFHRLFDELSDHWKDLMRAAHEAWKLDTPVN